MADPSDQASEAQEDLASVPASEDTLPGQTTSADQNKHNNDNNNDNNNSEVNTKPMDTSVDSSGGGTPGPATPRREMDRSPRTVPKTNQSPHAHSVDEDSPRPDGTGFDPTRLKERQERVRMVREKQAEERKRKLLEMQESQRRAQEFREKQQEERRRKIQEMRRRDQERRSVVEERRKKAMEKENERRKEILKKFQEKEFKLDTSKSKKGSGYGFGSRAPRAILIEPMDPSKRAASHSSLMRKSGANLDSPDSDKALPHRRAVSACSLMRNRGSPADKHGSVPNLHLSPSSNKRLSASTSYLARKKSHEPTAAANTTPATISSSSPRANSPVLGSISEKSGHHSFIAQKTPDSRRQRSRQSDITSSEGSPAHRRRPHSVAGRTPSYASPTSASDKRLSRSTEKKLKVDMNSPKNRSKSADTSRKRVDIEKTLSRLSQPKNPKREVSQEKPSPSKPVQPIRARESPKVKDTAKGGAQNTGSPSRQTGKKVQIQVRPPSPPPEKSKASPPRELPATVTVSRKTADKPARESLPSRSKDEKEGENAAKSLEEEYKAKLAEKRRQAKEKAEREAEAERQRQEELVLEEERRRLQEEEEQRRAEEEALRLAEEARRAEEERLRLAIEAEEKRKEEEAARLLAEQKAREEAEQRAREEAEKRERERQERAQKEEVERSERKKRLEMIMKRVKTSSPETVQKTDSSPANSKSSSPPQMMSPDEKPAEVEAAAPKFKSPLLQSLLGRKSAGPTPIIKVTSDSSESSNENGDVTGSDDTPALSRVTDDDAVSSAEPENVRESDNESAEPTAADSQTVVSIEAETAAVEAVAVEAAATVTAVEEDSALVDTTIGVKDDTVSEEITLDTASIDQQEKEVILVEADMNNAVESEVSAPSDVVNFVPDAMPSDTDEQMVENSKAVNNEALISATNSSFDPFATIEEDVDPSLLSSSQNNGAAEERTLIDVEMAETTREGDAMLNANNTRFNPFNEELDPQQPDQLLDVGSGEGDLVSEKEVDRIEEDKDVDTSVHATPSNVQLFDNMFGVQLQQNESVPPVNGHTSLEAQQTASTDSSDSPQSLTGQPEEPEHDGPLLDDTFEQLIDLSVANKNRQSTSVLLTANEADLINSNSIGPEPPTSPLIAFEDNSAKLAEPQGMPS